MRERQLCLFVCVRNCVCVCARNKETWLIEFYPRRNSKPARTTKLQPKRRDKRKGKREKLIRKQKILLICSRCIHCHKQFSWNFFRNFGITRAREKDENLFASFSMKTHAHTDRIRGIAFAMARISDRDGHFCIQKNTSHGCCVWANCQCLTGIRCKYSVCATNQRRQASSFMLRGHKIAENSDCSLLQPKVDARTRRQEWEVWKLCCKNNLSWPLNIRKHSSQAAIKLPHQTCAQSSEKKNEQPNDELEKVQQTPVNQTHFIYLSSGERDRVSARFAQTLDIFSLV